MADIPMDELSRSLAVLPDQYATGNWNGYGEKPLNRDSHRLEVGRQDSRPDQRGGKPPLHHAELTSWPQGDDEDAKLQRIDIATDLADASGYVARG